MTGFRRELRENHADFPLRIGLLLVIYALSLLLIPAWQAHLWLVVVVAMQTLMRRQIGFLLASSPRSFRRRIPLFVVTMVAANWALASMAGLLWLQGGTAHKIVAVFLLMEAAVHSAAFMTLTRITFAPVLAPHLAMIALLTGWDVARGASAQSIAVAMTALAIGAHLVFAAWRKMGVDAAVQHAWLTARRARRTAERATQAKSTFLATMSHEIRTPMNAVVASAQLLERSALDDGQRAHLSRLRRAAELTTGLLNDVLDLAKIEAGKMTMEQADTNLRASLTTVCDIWRERAVEKGLTFHLDIAPNLPERVLLDGLRLQQIVLNLLSNAVKFTSVGEVRVSVSWIDGAMLRVNVADTGIGIAADKLAAVFDSFEQGGASVAGRFGGTGLGLSISRQLAALMGGTLMARSVEGRGAVFTLEVPARPVSGASVDAGERPTHDLCGMRVLAVDDSEINLEVLSALLEPEGVELDVAHDGAEAVMRAQAERYDLILMDHRMPRMSGVEATRILRGGGVNRDTPIFAVTANAFEEQRREWAEVGVSEFVTKPIDLDALLGLIAAERKVA